MALTPPNNPYGNIQGLLDQSYQDPTQAMYGGAAQAMLPYMGMTDRPVSMGQVLAAAGGGAMRGKQVANQSNIGMAQIQQQFADAKTSRESAAQKSEIAKLQREGFLKYARKNGLQENLPNSYYINHQSEQAKITAANIGHDQDKEAARVLALAKKSGDKLKAATTLATNELSHATALTNRAQDLEYRFKGDFTKEVSEWRQVVDGYARMESILRDPTAPIVAENLIRSGDVRDSKLRAALESADGAADIAFMFGFMKAMDPRSTVRESELNMMGGLSGFGDAAVAAMKGIFSGEKMSAEVRLQLMQQARNAYTGAADKIDVAYERSLANVTEYADTNKYLIPPRAIKRNRYNTIYHPEDFEGPDGILSLEGFTEQE